MQHNIHERLLAHLADLGWTVARAAESRDAAAGRACRAPGFPGPLCPAVPRRRKRLVPVGRRLRRHGRQRLAWDEFKHLSLDAALDDEDRQGIHTFWDRHLPVLMSVAGDYEFLAIDQDTGAVVHGIEPEFEAVTVVADSWAGFCEAVIAGRVLPALFKQAS